MMALLIVHRLSVVGFFASQDSVPLHRQTWQSARYVLNELPHYDPSRGTLEYAEQHRAERS